MGTLVLAGTYLFAVVYPTLSLFHQSLFMSGIDWSVMLLAVVGIVLYGMYKGRGNKSLGNYFSAGSNTRWYTIGLSIMATQASAITFLSGPGQAFSDGMRFLQFYLGMPIAMILIAWLIVPIYKRLNVLTAYEYLGNRFDLKTRTLTAFLFLMQRGLAAGLTIYAPALVLSSILGWNIYYTNLAIGALVIVYTVFGGTKAVAHTHKLQMIVILGGMALAGVILISKLPDFLSFNDALDVAGKMGKLNVIDWEFDPDTKYNAWSGLLGGLFLALSYFGTDQSQVQRYLGDQPTSQSRIGLLFNGVVKIPMQFGILGIGVLLYVFATFNYQPEDIYSNKAAREEAIALSQDDPAYQKQLTASQSAWLKAKKALSENSKSLVTSTVEEKEKLAIIGRRLEESIKQHQADYIDLVQQKVPEATETDVNYVFISFVLNHFPVGIIGLLLACILFASMSSTSAELNALASTTMVDIYKRIFKKEASDKHYLNMSKWATASWGVYAILFAFFAGSIGSLIEAVNVLGSLFYGTILGVFVVGFFIKYIRGLAVFLAAIAAEAIVCLIYFNEWIAYLWLPLVGCVLVVGFGLLIQTALGNKEVRKI